MWFQHSTEAFAIREFGEHIQRLPEGNLFNCLFGVRSQDNDGQLRVLNPVKQFEPLVLRVLDIGRTPD